MLSLLLILFSHLKNRKIHDIIKTNARDGFRDTDSSGVRKMKALRRAVEGVLQGVEQKKIDDIMQLIVAQQEY